MDGLELSIVAADDPEATSKISQLDPQAILLDSDDTLLGRGSITRMLEEYPGARIVVLNLYRQGIEVYRMKRVLQTDLDGLLEAIWGEGTAVKPKLT